MIGLGSQYLTAAGFGRYRITAASLGNLDLLGSIGWLNGAAKAAILAAFGDDGKAVINATNVYLGGIAASDRDKATALAGFINEDPMMVCSLGLQPQGVTMPIRWLVGDGTAYMRFVGTPINSITKYTLRCSLKYEQSEIIGSAGRSCVMQWTDHILYTYDTNGYNSNGSYTDLQDAILEYGKAIISINGDSRGSVKSYASDSSDLQLFWGGRYGKATNRMARIEGDESLDLRPCKNPNGNDYGVLNLVNMQWVGNYAGSGAFGIAYTLPDGTPWTPSTP